MALKIKVDQSGAKRKLAMLETKVQSPEVYRTIGSVVLNRIRLCFKLGIDPWGNPWAALKVRRGQPLRDSGLMNRSITARPDASGVTIGTNLKHEGVSYPAVHQWGAVITPKRAKRLVFPGPNGRLIFAKKVTIPARPFLPLRKDAAAVALPPAWSEAVVRALRTYFLKGLN